MFCYRKQNPDIPRKINRLKTFNNLNIKYNNNIFEYEFERLIKRF